MQEGDSNSRYFHAVTSERRMRNKIERLENQGDDICEGKQEVTEIISEYFKQFSSLLIQLEENTSWMEFREKSKTLCFAHQASRGLSSNIIFNVLP